MVRGKVRTSGRGGRGGRSGGDPHPEPADDGTWLDIATAAAAAPPSHGAEHPQQPPHLPLEVLARVYKLDAPCSLAESKHVLGNCSANPLCLCALRTVKSDKDVLKLVAKVMGSAAPPAVEPPFSHTAAATAAGPISSDAMPAASEAATTEPPLPAPIRLPRGLRNLGNTCYASSILQLLQHTPTIRSLVLESGRLIYHAEEAAAAAAAASTGGPPAPTSPAGVAALRISGATSTAPRESKQLRRECPPSHNRSPNKREAEPYEGDGGDHASAAAAAAAPAVVFADTTDASREARQTVLSLAKLFAEMALAGYPSVDPSLFLEHHLQLDPKVQQDAQEFLGLFTSWLEQALVAMQTVGGPLPSGTGARAAVSCSDVLRRELESAVVAVRRCCACGNTTKKAEVSTFFSVPVKTQLVEALADLFAAVEVVEEVFCEGCAQRVNIDQTVEVKLLPHTLLLHINRFRYDVKNGQRVKLADSMHFPTVLDMAPFVSAPPSAAAHDATTAPPSALLTYRLEGVVNHLGLSPTSGHYTFHARDGPDEWSCYDDTEVGKLRKYYGETTSSKECYLLVYRRCTPQPSMQEAASSSSSSIPSCFVDYVERRNADAVARRADWTAREATVLADAQAWSGLAGTVFERHAPVSVSVPAMQRQPLYFVPSQWLTAFGSMFTAMTKAPKAAVPSLPKQQQEESNTSDVVIICSANGAAADDGAIPPLVNDAPPEGSGGAAVAAPVHDEPPVLHLQGYDGLVCPHGLLDPMAAASVKAISEEAFFLLYARHEEAFSVSSGGCSTGDRQVRPLSTNDGLCHACAGTVVVRLQGQRQSSTLDTQMQRLAQVELDAGRPVEGSSNSASSSFWVSKDFLANWYAGHFVPVVGSADANPPATAADGNEASGAGRDPAGDAQVPDVAAGLLCPHGGLRSDAAVHAVTADVFDYLLQTRGFRCAARFDSTAVDRCAVCIQRSVQDTSDRHGMKLRRLKEHKLFPTLAFVASHPTDVNRAVFRKDIAKYTKTHRKKWHEAQQQKRAAAAAAEEHQQRAAAAAADAARLARAPQSVATPARGGRGGRTSAPSAAAPQLPAEVPPKQQQQQVVVNVDADSRGPSAELPPPPASSADQCPPRTVDYFCVPTEWAEQWRAWQRADDTAGGSGSAPLLPAAPLAGLRALLCPHGGLSFPATALHPDQCAPLDKPLLTVLPLQEFQELVFAYYPSLAPIAAAAPAAASSPPPASAAASPVPAPQNTTTSSDSTRKQQQQQVIAVEDDDEDDENNSGGGGAAAIAAGPVVPPSAVVIRLREVDDSRLLAPATCAACAAAASERHRQATHLYTGSGVLAVNLHLKLNKRGNRFLDETETFGGLSHTDTLHALAELLANRLLEQHGFLLAPDTMLFCRGKQTLSDHQLTLSGCGLANGDAVTATATEVPQKVETHTQRVPAASPSSSSAGGGGGAGRAPEAAVTFANTRLSGIAPVATSASKQAAIVECPVCTFHNPAGSKECEMCTSPLS